MGKCYNSVTLNASIGDVWATVKDFHDFSWAPEVITKLEKVGDQDGGTPGAKRILNDLFHETLLSIDDANKILTYSIDDGPEPVSKQSVSNYVGTVRAYSVTNDDTSFLEWSSSYDSPNDQAVGDFCNPIYQALLSALKTHFIQ